MSDGYPSMTALLGLLALAGYQNRDKIAEMLGGAGQAARRPPAPAKRPAVRAVALEGFSAACWATGAARRLAGS